MNHLGRSIVTLGSLVALLLSVSTMARTERLDDSASPLNRVPAQWVMSDEGRPLAESRAPRYARAQFGRVDYRLATAKFVGRKAQIYYVIPASIPGLRSASGLQVTWRGDGVFASGVSRPGHRQLVWAGTVTTPWMNTSFELSMQLDLREVRASDNNHLGFESYFEIEVSP